MSLPFCVRINHVSFCLHRAQARVREPRASNGECGDRRISIHEVETLTALHPQRGACVAFAQGDTLKRITL
jgi:hypothetical protein